MKKALNNCLLRRFFVVLEKLQKSQKNSRLPYKTNMSRNESNVNKQWQ